MSWATYKMLNQDKSKAILRIAMSIVFLCFGWWQISSPDDWAGLVPRFLTSSILSANNFVVLNGIVELSLGTFMIIGLYTRFASLILALHLLGITFSLGFNPIGVRDFGLSIATLVVFFNGTDAYCIDNKFKKKIVEKKEDKKEKQ